MKQKIISIVLFSVIAFMVNIFPVSAQSDALLKNYPNASDNIVLNINIEDTEKFMPEKLIFTLYTADKRVLGTQSVWAYKPSEHSVIFNFPPTVLTDTVYVKVSSPVARITTNQKSYSTNDMIPFDTLIYTPDGQVIDKNNFYLSVLPLKTTPIRVYVNDISTSFTTSSKLIDGICMVPLFEYLSAASLREHAVFDKNSGRITVSVNDNTMEFFINSKNVVLNGSAIQSQKEAMLVKDTVFVPLRLLTEGLGGTVDASSDEENILTVRTELSDENKSEAFVNKNNIESKTDYLIWISKSDYKVTVFKKANKKWKYDRDFDCAIGAKNTPTITGQYEYYSKETRWSYPKYYCAPIMRFYNGYALHSTLIKYDGTPYDDTVGAMISHGCIRLHPEDIGWLADNIPLYTKIYITQ